MKNNELVKEWAEQNGCKNIEVRDDGVVFECEGFTIAVNLEGELAEIGHKDNIMQRINYRVKTYIEEKKLKKELGRDLTSNEWREMSKRLWG